MAVASSETSDANGVLALIVVLPYTTLSVALNVSPFTKVVYCELLSALKSVSYTHLTLPTICSV